MVLGNGCPEGVLYLLCTDVPSNGCPVHEEEWVQAVSFANQNVNGPPGFFLFGHLSAPRFGSENYLQSSHRGPADKHP